MNIYQFPYSQDNLAYLLVSGNQALAVDPGAVEEITEFSASSGLTIEYVVNTHSHYDHTGGNHAMLSRTRAQFIDCKEIVSEQSILLGQEQVRIFPSPGHTMDCVCLAAGDFLVTGDTLFNGTIGNCFSGNLTAFFSSITTLLGFPSQTRIFGGHDYVRQAMDAARYIEPDNPHISKYLQAYDSSFVVSTLEQELQVNPYLRFNAPEMIQLLAHKRLPRKTSFLRFQSIMEHF